MEDLHNWFNQVEGHTQPIGSSRSRKIIDGCLRNFLVLVFGHVSEYDDVGSLGKKLSQRKKSISKNGHNVNF